MVPENSGRTRRRGVTGTCPFEGNTYELSVGPTSRRTTRYSASVTIQLVEITRKDRCAMSQAYARSVAFRL